MLCCMNNKTTKLRKRRIPKLSEHPEPITNRYYTSFRTVEGKTRRQRFTTDRKESEFLYHRWIVETYDQSVQIIAKSDGFEKNNFEKSLPVIANAYLNHEKQRIRSDASRRVRGTISIRVFDDYRRQVKDILQWCQEHCQEKLKEVSFSELMNENDYESMMFYFVKHYSDSQVNKHRNRFWDIARFARREPFRSRLEFGRDDVRFFGGKEVRKKRQIPTIKIIQTILAKASIRERLWIWMGLGMGFGNDDLARVRPVHLSKENYDMRRGKTGFERYGVMRPMIWMHIKEYLSQYPRKEDELLFVTSKGSPIVWVRTKTEDELKEGNNNTPYKRGDNVARIWKKLKKDANVTEWKEGFYIWRHLGATAYASRSDIGIAQLRTFLGHGKSDVADEYMKQLSPELTPIINWINRMLDSNDINAWKLQTSPNST
jgi:integrase